MENNKESYFVEGELAFRSYVPKKLKPGMTFLSQVTVGIIEPVYNFFTLKEVPEDEEKFMVIHGAPVHMFIIVADNESEILALPQNIGYFYNNDGFVELTDELVNNILNDYDGYVDIMATENGVVIHKDEKVILAYLENAEDETEEDS